MQDITLFCVLYLHIPSTVLYDLYTLSSLYALTEFLSLPNLINTPHIGGNAIEAVNAIGESAIENILNWIKNGNNR